MRTHSKQSQSHPICCRFEKKKLLVQPLISPVTSVWFSFGPPQFPCLEQPALNPLGRHVVPCQGLSENCLPKHPYLCLQASPTSPARDSQTSLHLSNRLAHLGCHLIRPPYALPSGVVMPICPSTHVSLHNPKHLCRPARRKTSLL